MDLDAINEEWFTGKLAEGEIDTTELVSTFAEMVKAERGDEAAEWAQTLFQKFAENDDLDQALSILEWLAGYGSVSNAKEAVEKLLSKDRNALKMVDPAGFGGKLPETK